MAKTHVRLYIHVVFSTKGRFAFITPEIESELFGYIGGILNRLECKLMAQSGKITRFKIKIEIDGV